MGKTSIINKMKAEPPEDIRPVYRDLEKVRTAGEFIQIIYEDAETYLSGFKRLLKRTHKLLKQLGGAEIYGVKIPEIADVHWKQLLDTITEDLSEKQEHKVIFFWDEMPMMIDNIKNKEGEERAMEVLDSLRAVRQNYPRCRMVYTGSIGLHNVLTSLKLKGYLNDCINDMLTVDVPTLSLADGEKLALLLIQGEDIDTDSPEAIARTISEAVDNMPYFIHHVVDQMKWHEKKITVETVQEIVNNFLTDPQDTWHLSHYRERIDVYYGKEQSAIALPLLDILSVAEFPLAFDELFNLLSSRIKTENTEATRNMLMLLKRDHYITQHVDGRFQFRFPIIQRFWHLHRGLL